MATFFGRHEHTLDSKGRLILPSKLRAPFEQGGFLTNHSERCLALWTPDAFQAQMEQMAQRQEQGRAERNLARLWSSSTIEVDIDKQGRMAIPPYQREYARLEGDVLVIGAMDHVELWSPSEWTAKVEDTASSRLTGEEEDE